MAANAQFSSTAIRICDNMIYVSHIVTLSSRPFLEITEVDSGGTSRKRISIPKALYVIDVVSLVEKRIYILFDSFDEEAVRRGDSKSRLPSQKNRTDFLRGRVIPKNEHGRSPRNRI
jgi:hypothetical protein